MVHTVTWKIYIAQNMGNSGCSFMSKKKTTRDAAMRLLFAFFLPLLISLLHWEPTAADLDVPSPTTGDFGYVIPSSILQFTLLQQMVHRNPGCILVMKK